MLSINSYFWSMANKNGLDLHIFGSLSRIILARVAKIIRNSSEIEVAAPKGIFSKTARLELSVQLSVARAANARLARPVC